MMGFHPMRSACAFVMVGMFGFPAMPVAAAEWYAATGKSRSAVAAKSSIRAKPSGAYPKSTRAKIALVIDDLGHKLESAFDVLELPATLTVAVLPRTPFAKRVAILANDAGHEVILHQPMEPLGSLEPGPGKLTRSLARPVFQSILRDNLSGLPFIRGVNNHMGSRLTASPAHMDLVMETLVGNRGLYFLDSRTTARSVAERKALKVGIPAVSRDVFLDDPGRAESFTRQQLVQLERKALSKGFAVAIGHPYDGTISALRRWLTTLDMSRFELVTVSSVIQHRAAAALARLGEQPNRSTPWSRRPTGPLGTGSVERASYHGNQHNRY